MKKGGDKSILEDLLGAAAFSMSHFLDNGMEPVAAAAKLWQEHARHASAMGQPEQPLLLLRDGVIECVTPSCRTLFGADLSGHPFLDRVTPESGDIMAQRAKDKADGKTASRDLKLEFVRPDGGTFSGNMLVAEIYSEKGAFALALLSVESRPAMA